MKRLRIPRLRFYVPVALAVLIACSLMPASSTAEAEAERLSTARITLCSHDDLRGDLRPATDPPAGERRGPACRHCAATPLGTPFA